MRLYPKRLRSIEDLERERKLLQKEVRRIEEEGMPLGAVFSGKGQGESVAGSLIDMLPISNPLVTTVLKFLQRKFAARGDSSSAAPSPKGTKESKAKHPLKSVAIEFIGGYLKWKAIELSYKGIRQLLKKRKEKRAAEQ